jgi:hypothetical protein
LGTIASARFTGSQQQCKAYLRTITGHYVYILKRPDGRPFYVGKGVGDRVFSHENEARHPNDWRSNAYKLNVIRAIWRSSQSIIYEIHHITDDEPEAYARESLLIEFFKRLHEGGPLTNLAPGGGSTSGMAPLSRERHSATLGGVPDDNPERATLNGFVLGIARMKSVVIKPISQFTPRPTQRYPGKSMGLTLRQAAALVASAAVNGITMDDACEVPRRLQVEDVQGYIENGVSCDILTSGTASVIPAGDPANERFLLTAEQSRKVIGHIGLRKCADLGVVASRTAKT